MGQAQQQPPPPPQQPPVQSIQAQPKTPTTTSTTQHTECILQIRLTNGSILKGTFKPT